MSADEKVFYEAAGNGDVDAVRQLVTNGPALSFVRCASSEAYEDDSLPSVRRSLRFRPSD